MHENGALMNGATASKYGKNGTERNLFFNMYELGFLNYEILRHLILADDEKG